MKMSLFLMLLTLTACSSRDDKEKKLTEESQAVKMGNAQMHSATMKSVNGSVSFEEKEGSLIIKTDLIGLKPNAKLGFHIHENGVCEGPDYKTAGDHWNPTQMKHGNPTSHEKHKGDMGNLQTDKNGVSQMTITLADTTLEEVMGKAVLIHAAPDDFKTQPSGNSGARIACGLVRPIE